MPPADPGAGAALLQTFKAEAQKKGPAAAIQWLVNSKSAAPLQALVKTPQGRMALAAAALGFTAGFAGGANAPKVQALVTALKGVFDQNLPPAQAAQQIVQVLKAALTGGKAAKPIAPDRTAENRRVQSLTTSLKNAQANLKETEQLLKQRPGDQDPQIIFKGQTAKGFDEAPCVTIRLAIQTNHRQNAAMPEWKSSTTKRWTTERSRLTQASM